MSSASSSASATARAAATGSSSTSALVSTLIPAFVIALVCFGAFLFLRQRQRRVYVPRTFMDSLDDSEKSSPPEPGFTGFIKALWNARDIDLVKQQSLDAYLFLRYLKICAIICFGGCCITWPILFPVNATGGAPNVVELDLLAFSKIANKTRYYAQALIAWLFFGFVIFVVTRESLYFINIRAAYLISRGYQERLSSRVVLFTYLPQEYQKKGKLLSWFMGHASNAWIGQDCKQLTKLVQERDETALKLENAEIKICRTGHGKYLEAERKRAKQVAPEDARNNAAAPAQPSANTASSNNPAHATGQGIEMQNLNRPSKQQAPADQDVEAAAAAGPYAQWIQQEEIPTHRTKFLIGRKVNTISWCRDEMTKKISQIATERYNHSSGTAPYINSAFVEFNTQQAAHHATQRSYKGTELEGVETFIGIQPSEVIWENLALTRSSRRLRVIAATTFITLLIIFWAIPVAAVGAISNINFLTSKVHFLRFINHIPSKILGIVTGLLPVVALSILMSLVPVFCRMVAKASGVVSTVHVELWCQQWFYVFNVIQVFLVITIASAATTVVTKIIDDPSSTTSLLANNLPNASNFYISYFILQGLSIASMGLLQIGGLVGFLLLSRFLDKTPRKLHHRWTTLASNGWGALYPKFSLLCMIAIVYSCIAPLVLGFATVGIFLMYCCFKYNYHFVFTTDLSTNGAAYPRALQHLMVGVYIGEICLLGLFGIKVATGPLVLMGIFTVATLLYHALLNRAIGPMLKHIPLIMLADGPVGPKLPRKRKTLEQLHASDVSGQEGQTSSDDGRKLNSEMSMEGPPGSIPFLYKLFRIGSIEKESAAPGEEQAPRNSISRYIHVHSNNEPAKLLPAMPESNHGVDYTRRILDEAYFNPAITSPTPVVWIAKDPLGISTGEIASTDESIIITDAGAHIDAKNKVVWDMNEQVPIYTDRIVY